ncbi:Ubiquitin-associated domain-containing protein 2 [Echinococcus granulosus]|uniref:Ubiquitin associated domain containing protein n=1 Tax=Echinococcus granulosus TaxID=6210 RepID=A0A068WC07_ECHGR|nr:Ubiquitin-associated domain-containing protein 2 [Echinococcus granulosus]CDS15959.1 ubiquitin associated domain containing protein [Echinococcus granulosus]
MFPSFSYSGFYKTSVSKCSIFAVVTTSAFVHISGDAYRNLFIYDTNAIFNKHGIPNLLVMTVAGLPISRKSFLYLIGLRLATSSLGSLIVCGCGLLAGLVYQWKNLQKINLIPFGIAEIFNRLIGPLLSSEVPDDALNYIGATLDLQRQGALDRQEQALMDLRRTQLAYSNRRRNYAPQPHEVQNLVDMGFPEERSHLALTVAHGDVYEAINLLQDPSFNSH